MELLDAILSHITARRASHDSSILRSILRLSRVNTAFHNHIHGSTLLAQELFLTPNAHNNNVTCVLQEFELERRNTFRLGCLRCVDLGLDSPILRHISFHISCSQLRRKMPSWKVPSWREMFLTQPPLTELWVDFQGLPGGRQIPLVLLRRAGGIKLKDVTETTSELSERFGGRRSSDRSWDPSWVRFSAKLNGRGELWDREKRFGARIEV